MSVRIIKPGIADTIQDLGRYGYQHLGINPTGAMDVYAAQIANMLVGNDVNEAVIELHFPAAVLLFQQQALIALSGADFAATINDVVIPINTPVIIEKNAVLQFKKIKQGAICYLAVKEGLDIAKWLNSYSTNLKVNAGGYFGRRLKKDDIINFKKTTAYQSLLNKKDAAILPWKADVQELYIDKSRIRIIKGNEFSWLTNDAKSALLSSSINITAHSDRMGFRMKGETLHTIHQQQLLSSGITKGTIQLLPNGQLIILMAGHQTTGGYPRIAHVISADVPSLAQCSINTAVQFQLVEQEDAEHILYKHHQYLKQLQNACTFRLQEYLKQYEPYRS